VREVKCTLVARLNHVWRTLISRTNPPLADRNRGAFHSSTETAKPLLMRRRVLNMRNDWFTRHERAVNVVFYA
jgi:hypothetical protein